MISKALQNLRSLLFKSPKSDWTDREAWMRRAMLWKMTAMALKADARDESINKHYQLIMRADQYRAPMEDELLKSCGWIQKYIIDHQEKSKIVVAKS